MIGINSSVGSHPESARTWQAGLKELNRSAESMLPVGLLGLRSQRECMIYMCKGRKGRGPIYCILKDLCMNKANIQIKYHEQYKCIFIDMWIVCVNIYTVDLSIYVIYIYEHLGLHSTVLGTLVSSKASLHLQNLRKIEHLWRHWQKRNDKTRLVCWMISQATCTRRPDRSRLVMQVEQPRCLRNLSITASGAARAVPLGCRELGKGMPFS